MPRRALQRWILGLWSLGMPLLAAGLAFDRMTWLTAAGWALCAAVVLDGIGAIRVVRQARGLAG
jgi:hypothetical protein